MKGRAFTDTTNFLAIDYGDQILVDGRRYRILGHERESRFGLDDPKYWVKRAEDQQTGEKKIIKLAFFESFETVLGGVTIRRFRNPAKEGQVLKLVKDHPRLHARNLTPGLEGQSHPHFGSSAGPGLLPLHRFAEHGLCDLFGRVPSQHPQEVGQGLPGHPFSP